MPPLSNGGSRRRTKVESTDFSFFSSEKPLESSTFLQNESQGFIGQHQEEDVEEPVGASDETVSRRLLKDFSDTHPIETLGATSGTRQELNIENIKQQEPMSTSIFVARIPQTPLQASPKMVNAATQTSRAPLIVATSPSGAGSAVGQDLSMLPNAEEALMSNFDEGDKLLSCIIFTLGSLRHTAGSHLLIVFPETAEKSQYASHVSLYSNFLGESAF
ncbi:MAG: hypothetical protein ACRCTK_03880, partial [Alphaproteobacteria bacterium]